MFEKISKPEWRYKSEIGSYECRLSLIDKDILYAVSKGYSYGEDISKVENTIDLIRDEYFPSGMPFYFVSDIAAMTGSSTNARTIHLKSRLKQSDQTRLIIYSRPDVVFKTMIKAGRLFSSQLRHKVLISKDLEDALSIISDNRITFQMPDKDCSQTALTSDTDHADDLPDDIDILKNKIIALQKEKIERKNTVKEKLDHLIKIMAQITWGDSQKVEHIEIDDDDEFKDLFSAFNLLQMDLVELIKKQKEASEEAINNENQYQALFNNIADAVMLHDVKTHRFVDCNQKALQYGYTKEEMLSMTPYDLHPAEDLNKVDENIDKLNEAAGTGNRYKHVYKDGTQVDVEILSSKLIYKGKPTWISIVRDITERMQIEKAIIEKQKEAEAASRAKSEFLANMSHEIRTPMNGVIGMLDLLVETKLSGEQHEFAVSAQHSADSLLILINDILDFSKIEAGKLEVETIAFDLAITLDALSDLLSVKAYEKGIDYGCLIENNVPLFLKGDPSRLRQILLNLSGNALKFTSEGEILVKVSLKNETPAEAELLFEIIDTGTGIPQDKISTLFESFTQVDSSTTRKYGGTGLGLAISKQLAELMGGSLNVKSTLEKGSNFYFTTTFEKQKGKQQQFQLADHFKNEKILIVDDNKTNRKIFKAYLKSWQCSFDTVNSGHDALVMLQKASKLKNPYKIALIDMQMPSISGEELCIKIKNDKNIKDTILILLSSAAERGDAQKYKKAGFAGFLTKPVKKRKLFDVIRAALSVNLQEIEQSEKLLVTSYKAEEIKKNQAQEKPGLKILIAEDNRINQRVVMKMLQGVSEKLSIANNGKEAVDLFSKEEFDAIFMDIQMPVMDGVEAIKTIRMLEKEGIADHHIPIIALTANAMKGDKERFLACGADGYLSKPMKKDALHKTMESLNLIYF